MKYTKKQLLEWVYNHLEGDSRVEVAEELNLPGIATLKVQIITDIIEELNNGTMDDVLWIADCLCIPIDVMAYIAKAKKAQLVAGLMVHFLDESDMEDTVKEDMGY